MKKISLRLISLLLVATPTAIVVSCAGDNNKVKANPPAKIKKISEPNKLPKTKKSPPKQTKKLNHQNEEDISYAGKILPANFTLSHEKIFIDKGEFKGSTLPSGFYLPSTIEVISEAAFEGATLPNDFTIKGSGLRAIGKNAFKDVILPENFSLPNSVTSIDSTSFEGATFSGFNFKSNKIHWNLFQGANISKLLIPNTILEIGMRAFKNSILPNDFLLPKNIRKIGQEAFEGTALPNNFIIPAKAVNDIGYQAFKNATLATNYLISDWDTYRILKHNNVKDIDKRIGPNFLIKGGFARANSSKYERNNILSSGILKNVILPKGTTISNNISWIDTSAFEGATLPNSFVLPTSLTNIGAKAFKNANFENGFVIPSSVVSIGPNAFEGTKLFGNFVIPYRATILTGKDAFKNVVLDQDMEVNDWDTFKVLKKNNVPNVFSHIGPNFEVRSNETSIDANFFKNNVLPQSFRLKNVDWVQESAFEGATLPKGFTLDKVKLIGENAFKNAIFANDFKITKVFLVNHKSSFEGAIRQDGSEIKVPKISDLINKEI